MTDFEQILAEAQLAERGKRWTDCFSLCQKALAISPNHPDALNVLGRVFRQRGDAAMAIGLQCLVLRLIPGHPRAANDLMLARAAIPSSEAAERLYESALALEPDIGYHHRPLGSPQPFVGMDRVEAVVRAALHLDPSFALAHAALGNILARRGNREAAMSAYGLAVMLDWAYADAHIALAEFYDADADAEASASQHFAEALSRKVLFTSRAPFAARRVLVLKAPGGFPANALLDFCIDHNRTDLDVFYVTKGATTIPDSLDYGVIWSALGETEVHRDAIDRCITLLAAVRKRVINHPSHLKKIRRSELNSTLRNVPGCTVPKTVRLARDVVESLIDAEPRGDVQFPVIIRPVDTHRGDGMELVSAPGAFRDYLSRFQNKYFNLTPFVDYRSADGYYRKYRVIVVAGKPFAYHLAISEEWLVHYWRVGNLMQQHAWMLEEEESFLRAPGSIFPTWDSTFRNMAEATGLDYFGVDCAVTDNGQVLVFECDPIAWVHCRDMTDRFAYKYEYVPRIFDAVDELLGSGSDVAP